MKDVQPKQEIQLKQTLMRLKNKAFVLKMLPHFVRGIGGAASGMFMVIGLQNVPLNAGQSTLVIVIGIVAQMASHVLYLKICKSLRSGVIVLASYGVVGVTMLLVPFVNSVMGLLLLYGVFFAAECIGGHAIPVGVIRSTPVKDLPAVSSIRMMLLNLTQCIFLPVFGGVIETAPIAAMIIGAVFYGIMGLLFMRQLKDNLDEQE